MGVYFGYPSCCIQWFVENFGEPDEFIELNKRQESVHGGNGFIPCPKCAEKVTKKTISTLIRNRICDKKFPNP
jgi:hypothetical protein